MYSTQNFSRFLLVDSVILDFGIQRKESESGIPLTIAIRNPQRGVQNLKTLGIPTEGYLDHLWEIDDLKFLSFNLI